MACGFACELCGKCNGENKKLVQMEEEAAKELQAEVAAQ